MRIPDVTSALLDSASMNVAHSNTINPNAATSSALSLSSAFVPVPILPMANVPALRKLVLEAICGIFVETDCVSVVAFFLVLT